MFQSTWTFDGALCWTPLFNLPTKSGEDVEEKSEEDAEQQGSSQWEKDGDVLAAPGEIAGQVADADAEAVERVDYPACNDQQKSEFYQQSREGHNLRLSKAAV
jgi:hypothetical protein